MSAETKFEGPGAALWLMAGRRSDLHMSWLVLALCWLLILGTLVSLAGALGAQVSYDNITYLEEQYNKRMGRDESAIYQSRYMAENRQKLVIKYLVRSAYCFAILIGLAITAKLTLDPRPCHADPLPVESPAACKAYCPTLNATCAVLDATMSCHDSLESGCDCDGCCSDNLLGATKRHFAAALAYQDWYETAHPFLYLVWLYSAATAAAWFIHALFFVKLKDHAPWLVTARDTLANFAMIFITFLGEGLPFVIEFLGVFLACLNIFIPEEFQAEADKESDQSLNSGQRHGWLYNACEEGGVITAKDVNSTIEIVNGRLYIDGQERLLYFDKNPKLIASQGWPEHGYAELHVKGTIKEVLEKDELKPRQRENYPFGWVLIDVDPGLRWKEAVTGLDLWKPGGDPSAVMSWTKLPPGTKTKDMLMIENTDLANRLADSLTITREEWERDFAPSPTRQGIPYVTTSHLVCDVGIEHQKRVYYQPVALQELPSALQKKNLSEHEARLFSDKKPYHALTDSLESVNRTRRLEASRGFAPLYDGTSWERTCDAIFTEAELRSMGIGVFGVGGLPAIDKDCFVGVTKMHSIPSLKALESSAATTTKDEPSAADQADEAKPTSAAAPGEEASPPADEAPPSSPSKPKAVEEPKVAMIAPEAGDAQALGAKWFCWGKSEPPASERYENEELAKLLESDIKDDPEEHKLELLSEKPEYDVNPHVPQADFKYVDDESLRYNHYIQVENGQDVSYYMPVAMVKASKYTWEVFDKPGKYRGFELKNSKLRDELRKRDKDSALQSKPTTRKMLVEWGVETELRRAVASKGAENAQQTTTTQEGGEGEGAEDTQPRMPCLFDSFIEVSVSSGAEWVLVAKKPDKGKLIKPEDNKVLDKMLREEYEKNPALSSVKFNASDLSKLGLHALHSDAYITIEVKAGYGNKTLFFQPGGEPKWLRPCHRILHYSKSLYGLRHGESKQGEGKGHELVAVKSFYVPCREPWKMPNFGSGPQLNTKIWFYREFDGWRLWLRTALPVAAGWMNLFVTGCVGVIVYFLDVSSDINVAVLFLKSTNYTWAAFAFIFLILQYVVVWVRVKDYFANVFGEKSFRYQVMAFPPTGFILLLGLDMLMLVEIFGVLPHLPTCIMPIWMSEFLPSFRATRLVTEVILESALQCLLQSYVYVVVSHAASQSSCVPLPFAYTSMLGEIDALPFSIRISILSFLKTWFELNLEASKSGISLLEKVTQLWQMGRGLPLDAMKKSTIKAYKADQSFSQDNEEGTHRGPLLIQALMSNMSIETMDLSRGFANDPGFFFKDDAYFSKYYWLAQANFMKLINGMAENSAVLASLQTLYIAPSRTPWLNVVKAPPFRAERSGYGQETFYLRYRADRPLYSTNMRQWRRGDLHIIDNGATSGFAIRVADLRAENRIAANRFKDRLHLLEFEHANSVNHIEIFVMLSLQPEELDEAGEKALQDKIEELRKMTDGAKNALSAAPPKAEEGESAEELAERLRKQREEAAKAYKKAKEDAKGAWDREVKERIGGRHRLKEALIKKLVEPKMLKAVGFAPVVVRLSGWRLDQMKADGYSTQQLFAAGYGVKRLHERDATPDLTQIVNTLVIGAEDVGSTIEIKAAEKNVIYIDDFPREAAWPPILVPSLERNGNLPWPPFWLPPSGLKLMIVHVPKVDGSGARWDAAKESNWVELEGGYKIPNPAAATVTAMRDAMIQAGNLRGKGFKAWELGLELGNRQFSTSGLAQHYTVKDLRQEVKEIEKTESDEVKRVEAHFKARKLLATAADASREPDYGGQSVERMMQGGFKAAELITIKAEGDDAVADAIKELMQKQNPLKASEVAGEAPLSSTDVDKLLYINTNDRVVEVGGHYRVSLWTRAQWEGIENILPQDSDGILYAKIVSVTRKQPQEALSKEDAVLREDNALSVEVELIEGDEGSKKKTLILGLFAYELSVCKKLGIKAEVVRKARESSFVGPPAIDPAPAPPKEGEEPSKPPDDGAAGLVLAMLDEKWTLAELKDGGFEATSMRRAGKSLKELLEEGGYDPKKLTAAGFGVAEFRRDCGYDATKLKDAGFSAKAMRDAQVGGLSRFTLNELGKSGAGFSGTELKEAGFSAEELLVDGAELKELQEAGYKPAELKRDGKLAFGPNDIKKLKEAGYTARALRTKTDEWKPPEASPDATPPDGPFTLAQLRDQGEFEWKELRDAEYTVDELSKEIKKKAKDGKEGEDEVLTVLIEAGFTPKQLVKLIGMGAGGGKDSIRKFKELNFTASALKEDGYELEDIQKVYELPDLLEAKFELERLKKYYTLGDFVVQMRSDKIFEQLEPLKLKEVGQYSLQEMADAGFTAEEFKQAQFTAVELLQFNGTGQRYGNLRMVELKKVGYTAEEMLKQPRNKAPPQLLKMMYDAKFTVEEVVLASNKLEAEAKQKGAETADEETAIEPSYGSLAVMQLKIAGYGATDIWPIVKKGTAFSEAEFDKAFEDDNLLFMKKGIATGVGAAKDAVGAISNFFGL